MRRKKNKITPTTDGWWLRWWWKWQWRGLAESSVTTRGCDMGKTTAETEIYSMARGAMGRMTAKRSAIVREKGGGKKGI